MTTLNGFDIRHVFAAKGHMTAGEYKDYLFNRAREHGLITISEWRRLWLTFEEQVRGKHFFSPSKRTMATLHAMERILYSRWLALMRDEEAGNLNDSANSEESLFNKLIPEQDGN